MAIAVVQHVKNETNVSQNNVAVTTSSTVGGNLLVVGVANTGTLTTVGVVDNKGNTYQKVPNSDFVGATTDKGDVWFCPRAISGVTSVTITYSTTDTSFKCGWVWEVSGISSPVVDGAIAANNQIGAGTSDAGAILLTRTTAGFAVGVIVTSGGIATNPTGGNEFSAGGDIQATSGNAACSLIYNTAATHQPVWTDGGSGANYGAVTVAFFESLGLGVTIGGTSSHPGISPGNFPASRRFWLAPIAVSPVVTVAANVTPFPILIVSLIVFRRDKPKVKIVLGRIFGRPTSKVKPKAAKQLSFAAIQRMRVKYVAFNVKTFKKYGKATKAVQPKSPRLLDQTINRQNIQRRFKTKATLNKKPTTAIVIVVSRTKPIRLITIATKSLARFIKKQSKFNKTFGRPTQKPIVRPPQVLSFANKEATRKNRFIPVKIIIVTPTPFAQPTGHTVTLYGGLWVANGLMYHHGLDRPTIILTPVGGGKFNVVKVSGLSDELADQLDKQVVIIDGELP